MSRALILTVFLIAVACNKEEEVKWKYVVGDYENVHFMGYALHGGSGGVNEKEIIRAPSIRIDFFANFTEYQENMFVSIERNDLPYFSGYLQPVETDSLTYSKFKIRLQ